MVFTFVHFCHGRYSKNLYFVFINLNISNDALCNYWTQLSLLLHTMWTFKKLSLTNNSFNKAGDMYSVNICVVFRSAWTFKTNHQTVLLILNVRININEFWIGIESYFISYYFRYVIVFLPTDFLSLCEVEVFAIL